MHEYGIANLRCRELAEFDFSRAVIENGEECSLNHPFVMIQWEGVVGEELFSPIPEEGEQEEEKETEWKEFSSCDPEKIKLVVQDITKRTTVSLM